MRRRFTKADRELLRRDLALARIIRRVRLAPIKLPRDAFWALAEIILSQQLSDKAATTIILRFRKAAVGGRGPRLPRPNDILRLRSARFRAAGVSGAKTSYLKDLARRAKGGHLHIQKFRRMTGEAIKQELVAVKGIGKWSAEMFLIFGLGRPDIFSPDDLGLWNAIRRLYGVRTRNHKRLARFAIRWAPHRSLACRYLWASLTLARKVNKSR